MKGYVLDILFGRQGILCERNDISFVGIQNVICRIINTAKYSVDSGVLDLILSVMFLVRNIIKWVLSTDKTMGDMWMRNN